MMTTSSALRTANAASRLPTSKLSTVPPEPGLRHRQRVLGMEVEPRIDHAGQPGCPSSACATASAVVGLRAHAQVHRLQALEHDPGGEGRHRPARVLHVGLERLADELLGPQHDAAQRPALPVHVLGRRIDDDVGAQLHRAAEDRRGEDVVGDHQRARGMGDLGHARDVDDLQRRVRHASRRTPPWSPAAPPRATGRGRCRPRRSPRPRSGAAPPPGRRGRTRTARASRDHMVAGPQHRHERARHGGHARGRGEGVLGPLERGHPLLEHRGRGVAVAGVDELVRARIRGTAPRRPRRCRRRTPGSGRSPRSPRRTGCGGCRRERPGCASSSRS